MWIIVALVVVPIIEIALFIQVGGWLGLWPTIAIVILTAVLGGVLLRQQGVRTVRALQAQLARGADPSPLLLEGAMLLVGGVLLLTPGFFTDAVGLALLVPQVRAAVAARALPYLAARVVTVGGGFARTTRQGDGFGADRGGPTGGPIDAEYREVETPPPYGDRRPPRD
jgi:UPF0716 protein FxsA